MFPIICTFAILLSQATYAKQPSSADDDINVLYQHLPANLSLKQKLDYFSQAFLGKSYVLGALGEGKTGYYDQSPLYRTDGFDCTTYVATVLALTNAKNIEQFKKNIRKINYKDSKVSYLTRNHFMSVDWLPTNIKNGYVKDINDKIADSQRQPIYTIAVATIDKAGWLKKRTAKDIKIKETSAVPERLQTLKQNADQYPKRISKLKYLHFSKLFSKNGQPNMAYFDQIPNGSIIQIVRPNWQLKELIGSNLNISHLGFAIRKDNQLLFREASSIENKVIDIPLIEYLHGYLDSPTIRGISIFELTQPKKS